jgi:hypothetical protein
MKMKILLLPILLFLGISCTKINASDDVANPAAHHNKSVGTAAQQLLTAQAYNALKVEVQYMPGFEPDAKALSNLELFLATYLYKPAGITIVTKEIPAIADTVLHRNEVVLVERDNRTAFTKGTEIAVYIVYTNGGCVDSNVLATAYRNTSIVMYGKTIHQNSGRAGKPSRTQLESTVLMHEMAHLMGLVNVGTGLKEDHQDEKNGSHCNNKKCLMYHAVETTDAFSLLRKGRIPQLDAACKKDLKKLGGR